MRANLKFQGSSWIFLGLLFGYSTASTIVTCAAQGSEGEVPAWPSPNRLVSAAKEQDRVLLRKLLDRRADVNASQADGATALHWAAYWDDLETLNLLIEAGARVNAANDLGVTPLSLASANGSPALVGALLKAGADPNTLPSTGETPLMAAARSGSIEAVTALLSHGAEVDTKTPVSEQTALMWALSKKHFGVAQMLIEQGASISARSALGFTALLFATRQGDLDGARILLSAGADLNETSPDGSALLVATIRGHVSLAIFLLDQGANPNADETGYTALHWATGSWETEMTGPNGIVTPVNHEWRMMAGLQERKLELVKALLERGANPNARLEKQPPRVGYTKENEKPIGATPFLLAAMAGDADVMRVLADGGASPLLMSKDKTTPLMMAAGVRRDLSESRASESSSLKAVRLALKLGADVNASNDEGDTALHGAARIKSDAIVQLLVDSGARMDAKNKLGQTPLFIAERYFHPGSPPLLVQTSTADLLRRLGANKVVSEKVQK